MKSLVFRTLRALECALRTGGAMRRRFRAGKLLYESLMQILKCCGYYNVFGVLTLPNAASCALLKRLLFRRCATLERVGYKFGAWHDVAYFQRTLNAPQANCTAEEPLRGASAIRQSVAIRNIVQTQNEALSAL